MGHHEPEVIDWDAPLSIQNRITQSRDEMTILFALKDEEDEIVQMLFVSTTNLSQSIFELLIADETVLIAVEKTESSF